MGELIAEIVSIAVILAAGLALARTFSPRSKCWRCKVLMLAVRIRERKFSGLPIGQCEGCGVWCFALGRRAAKRRGAGTIPVKQRTSAR
jgi:hypothetical protein